MREDKIRKNSEFRRVYKNGKSIANHLLVLYFYKNNKRYSRFGISVSKKVGKSVTRSRVKRLIRESTRLNEKHIALGYDIVIIARVSSNDKGYKEIEKALINLLKKAGLFCNEKDINKYN